MLDMDEAWRKNPDRLEEKRSREYNCINCHKIPLILTRVQLLEKKKGKRDDGGKTF